MKIIKRVMLFLIDPFHKFGSGDTNEKITRTFNRNKYLVYLLSLLITVVIVYLLYFTK